MCLIMRDCFVLYCLVVIVLFYLPGDRSWSWLLFDFVDRDSICQAVTNPVLFHLFVRIINYIRSMVFLLPSTLIDRYLYVDLYYYGTTITGQFQNCLITSCLAPLVVSPMADPIYFSSPSSNRCFYLPNYVCSPILFD